ncbi:hypothetical protein HMPREF9694_05511 [Klebsiella michiganensis]|nr:hypothetical protein HMPREF9694_05511 [Klebsiella michiganensis]
MKTLITLFRIHKQNNYKSGIYYVQKDRKRGRASDQKWTHLHQRNNLGLLLKPP